MSVACGVFSRRPRGRQDHEKSVNRTIDLHGFRQVSARQCQRLFGRAESGQTTWWSDAANRPDHRGRGYSPPDRRAGAHPVSGKLRPLPVFSVRLTGPPGVSNSRTNPDTSFRENGRDVHFAAPWALFVSNHRVLIGGPAHPNKKGPLRDPLSLAERAGFEPAIRFHVYTLSRRAPSTTRTPLRNRSVARQGYSGVEGSPAVPRSPWAVRGTTV